MHGNGLWILIPDTNQIQCSEHRWMWDAEDTESECPDCAHDDYLTEKAERRHEM